MSPTDTFAQLWAQAMGGDGYAMAFVLFAVILAFFAVAGVMGCIHELWYSRKRADAKRQRQLEDSVRRAGGEKWQRQSLK